MSQTIVQRYRKFKKREIQLHDWQKENMEFIEKNRYCIIADDMGLGKTFSALATVKKNNLYPCLIICPKALKVNWYREIKRIDRSKSVDLLKGNMSHIPIKNERFAKDYSLIQYNSTKLIEKMPQVKSIILDEIHYLKGYKAQRTKVIQKWIREKSNATHVIGLSGTPMVNIQGSEIFTVVNVLHCNVDKSGNVPENYYETIGGGLLTYQEFFGNGNDKFVYEEHKNPHNPDTITGYLVKPERQQELSKLLKDRGIMIRHTKSILYALGLLTELIKEPIVIEEPKGYRKKLDELYSLYGGIKIAQLTKIRQWLAMAKVPFVIEYVKNITENYKNKVIIFGNYKAPLRALAVEFNTVSHDGDMKTPERQKLVDEFMIQKKTRVLIMTAITGGVGLNLTEANHVVFNDYSYSPAVMEQAESRAHRLGQKNNVTIHYITAENTVDEQAVNLLTKKSMIINGIIDGTPYVYDEKGIEQTIVDKLNKMIREQRVRKTKTARFHQKK